MSLIIEVLNKLVYLEQKVVLKMNNFTINDLKVDL